MSSPMNAPSLLDKAKSYRTNRTTSTRPHDPREEGRGVRMEVLDLALGWARGEVSMGQAMRALEMPKEQTFRFYILMARAFKHATVAGYVTTTDKEKGEG